jgi:hypothetical protein
MVNIIYLLLSLLGSSVLAGGLDNELPRFTIDRDFPYQDKVDPTSFEALLQQAKKGVRSRLSDPKAYSFPEKYAIQTDSGILQYYNIDQYDRDILTDAFGKHKHMAGLDVVLTANLAHSINSSFDVAKDICDLKGEPCVEYNGKRELKDRLVQDCTEKKIRVSPFYPFEETQIRASVLLYLDAMTNLCPGLLRSTEVNAKLQGASKGHVAPASDAGEGEKDAR